MVRNACDQSSSAYQFYNKKAMNLLYKLFIAENAVIRRFVYQEEHQETDVEDIVMAVARYSVYTIIVQLMSWV